MPRWSGLPLLLLALRVQAQMTLAPGTDLRIEEGSALHVDSPISWSVPEGAVLRNDGTITLHPEALFQEALGAAVLGQGVERITVPLASAASNPGGLGLSVSATGEGPISLTRGHQALQSTELGASVERWYTVESAALPQALVSFHYDPSELNGLAPAELLLFRQHPAPEPWEAFITSSGTHSLSTTMPLPATLTAFAGGPHIGLPETGKETFLIAPNPANGPVRISAGTGYMIRSLRVLDGGGRTVYRAPVPTPAQEVVITTSGLASGLYILLIDERHRSPLIVP